MERQPEFFGQVKIVIALGQMLGISGREVHVGISDAPRVLRAEDQAVLKTDADTVELVAIEIGFLAAVSPKQPDDVRELLVEAQSEAGARWASGVVGAEPRPIGAFGKRERRKR